MLDSFCSICCFHVSHRSRCVLKYLFYHNQLIGYISFYIQNERYKLRVISFSIFVSKSLSHFNACGDKKRPNLRFELENHFSSYRSHSDIALTYYPRSPDIESWRIPDSCLPRALVGVYTWPKWVRNLQFSMFCAH